MEALDKFVYAPPNGKLARRLAQMAELGGCESSPIHIASMASCALLLKTSACTRSLAVCEDGAAVRVVHRKEQPGHQDTNKGSESPDKHQQVASMYRLTHAIVGDTPGAASFLAEGPLRTWLSDGCHTSLVCLGLSSSTRPTTRSSPTTSPDSTTQLPGATPACLYAGFLQSTAGAIAPTPVEAALPAALEVLLGLERPSVLLECLHAAFSGRTGASGVALWCFELYDANAGSHSYSSDSISDSVDGPGGVRSNRGAGDRGSGAWRRGVVAARPGDGGIGGNGGGGRWRDLMAEAVAETVAQASQESATKSAASVGSGGGRGSTAGSGGGKARAHGVTRGSAGAAATSIAAVKGPARVASVAEAIAALHAAFCRSSLWRRRDPSRRCPSAATSAAVAAQGPLLEPAIGLGSSAAAQIFVRLGLRLPSQAEKMQHHHQQGGAASGSGPAARGEAVQRSWTTLDLVFIGCAKPQPQQHQAPATATDTNKDIGGPAPASGPSGPPGSGGGVGLALGQVRELLSELVARQDGETGIPRPLRSTSRPQSNDLCLQLAHLLAGNVAPHLLLVLPASLPDAEEDPTGNQYALGTLELFSRARAIRTVITKSEPPPPLYGASLAEPFAASSPRDSDRQVASLMRLRHSQEMKDVVRAYRRGAATEPGTPPAGGAVAPFDSDTTTSTAAAADTIRTSMSGSSRCTTSAASAGGSDSVLAVPGMQSRDGTGILGPMDFRLIAATSSHTASALPASFRAVPLESSRWSADPHRDKSEPPSPPGADGRSSGGPQDSAGNHIGMYMRTMGPAAGARPTRQQLDANTRHGHVGRTPSPTVPPQLGKHPCGGGSGRGKAAPPAHGDENATRRTDNQQQTDAKGASSLVGGLSRLQRRLESLQKSRILREAEAALTTTATATATAVARADRYASAPGAASHGSSSGAAGGDSDRDSSRSASARGIDSASDGLCDSSSSRGRAVAAAVPLQPHASSTLAQTANAPPDGASTMRRYSGGVPRSQLGSWYVQQQQQQQQQPLQQTVLSQLQAGLVRQVAPVVVAAPAANTAAVASAAASPSPASAATIAALAEERLARLRSEFEQLYEGLVSKVLQDSPSAAADATHAAVDRNGPDVSHPAQLSEQPPPPPPPPPPPRPLSASLHSQQPGIIQACRAVSTVTEAAAAAEAPNAFPPRSGQQAATDKMESCGSQTSRFLDTESAPSALELYGRGSRDLAPVSAVGGAALTTALASASPAKPKATSYNGGGGGSTQNGAAHNLRSNGSGSGNIVANWINANVSVSIGAGGGGSGKPSSDIAGDRRRSSTAAAWRPPSATSPRPSSGVAWAALPHAVPGQGLYGALLAGYAAEGLEKPVAGPRPKFRAAQAAGGGGGRSPPSDTIRYCTDKGRDEDYATIGGGGAVILSEDSVDKAARGSGGTGGGISGTGTGESDWHRLRPPGEGGFPKSGDAAAVVATAVSAHDSGSTGAGAVGTTLSPSNNTSGLEHLLDSSSNSSGGGNGIQEAVREEDSDGSAAFGALSGAVAMAAAGGTGLQNPAWGQSVLREDGKVMDLKGDGESGSGELLAAWPSAGATEFRRRSRTIGSLGGTCGGAGGVLSSEGSGDDASLGSWNPRIAHDAMSIAAALSSPSSPQPQPTAPLPATPSGGGSAAANPTRVVAGTPELSPSRLGCKTSPLNSAAWTAVNMHTTAASSQTVSPSAASAASLPQAESCKTRPQAARSSTVAATVAAASEAPNAGTVPLRQRNQALLGVLERAAAGSEALQEKLYDAQVELMELRTLMEVQQATHDEEVARLRRHLRRAAVAEAEAEGTTSVLAATPTGTGGRCGERRLAAAEASAASAALAALMAAYEEDIDGLRRQVADLIAGQRDLAILCAEQDLAALAMDAVRSRRRDPHQHHLPKQHAAGDAIAAASTGGGGAASSAYPTSFKAAALSARDVAPASGGTAVGSGDGPKGAVDALATPHSRAALSPARGRLLAAAPSPSSSPPQEPQQQQQQQQQRRQRQHQAEQPRPQTRLRSRSAGPERGGACRRRHSCGPKVGGASTPSTSSPFRIGVAATAAAGPAPPRSRSRLGASADSAHTYMYRYRYTDGADSDASLEGLGGGDGCSNGVAGEAGGRWWLLSGTARGSTPRAVSAGNAEVAWQRGQKEMG
ncbi:hypothetical protein Vretimale_7746, partial [Volvox reticuliferus]